jgi:4-oxalomesaconate hydratase
MAEVAKTAKTGLVVSAHSADFVWRAAGAIALYAKRSWTMKVVCLSYGERGESAKLWRMPGMTLERVKQDRRAEATRAAELLGAQIEFLDVGDYPMRVPESALYRLVDIYRELRPEFVLSHSLEDPYNFDHPLASHVAQEARIIAQAHGHNPGETVLGAPPVFLVRTAPDRAMQLEASGAARHHRSLGPEAKAFELMACTGTPVGVLHAGRAAAGRAGRAQFEPQDQVCGSVPAGVSARHGRSRMNNIAIRNIVRAGAAAIDRLGAFGVATAHEAMGRSGLMQPYLRPIYPGAEAAGSAITGARASRRQLDAACRRRTLSPR